MKSREVVLANRPVGMPTVEDFEIREAELPNPGIGEVLVRNVCMSVDPYMRGRMIDRKSYTSPFAVGDTLTGGAIGRVEHSNHTNLKEGEYVESHLGWREAFVGKATGLRPLGELEAPASAYLGVLGMPGMTAYVGSSGRRRTNPGRVRIRLRRRRRGRQRRRPDREDQGMQGRRQRGQRREGPPPHG